MAKLSDHKPAAAAPAGDTPKPAAKQTVKKTTAAKASTTAKAKEDPKPAPVARQTLADVREPINILYYGDGGTGKTTNLAMMANQGRVVYVNAEAGLKARPLRKLGVNVANIELFPNREAGERLDYDSLEALYWRMLAELDDNPEAYAGCVWDSVTEIHKALLDGVVEGAVAKADRMGKERDPFFIDIADYGVMTEQMRRLLRKFRDLPCHFGASALARRMQDDDGAVTYGPAVTPALATDLHGYMDIVCYTEVVEVAGEEEFRGKFAPVGKVRGKDRFSALPKKGLVDPTFERIRAYVEEELGLEEDPVMAAARERRKGAEAEKVAEEVAGGEAA
jgi:hypothetical protein